MTLRNCNLCLVLNLEPWIYTLPPAQTALLVFPRRSMNFKRIFCCPAVALMSIIKIKARFIFSCSYRMSHVCSFEHQSHQIVLTIDDLDRTLRGGACYWHTPGSLICDVQIWRINPSSSPPSPSLERINCCSRFSRPFPRLLHFFLSGGLSY